MIGTIVWTGIFVGIILFIWHCPIFKPWFGFRRPPGHQGKWWT